MTRTMAELKKIEAKRAELAKKIEQGKAGRRDHAEAELASLDRQAAALLGVTVEKLQGMRK